MTLDAAASSPQRPKRILVCVSGTSPAIVTETLYALVFQPEPFLPDEIHVITTARGRREICDKLLSPQTGALHRLLADASQPLGTLSPRLDDTTIHVIATKDQPTQGLEDIVTLEDNRAAAQTIYRVMRELKAVPGTQIHASVAGGRKSMSFYMGQAFSLLADAGDVLSHVLVNEPFEHPGYGFFFPPAQPTTLTDRFGKKDPCHTADARIELAEMSVLKLGPVLRKALPATALEDFDEAVNLAQGLLAPCDAQLLVCASGRKHTGIVRLLGKDIELAPAQFCLLLLHACAQHMLAQGRIKRAALKYSEETLPDQAWGEIGLTCNLSPWKATRVPDLAPAFSRIVKSARPLIGDVAERLYIEANGKGRYQLSSAAPQFSFPALLQSAPLRALLERTVTRMAA